MSARKSMPVAGVARTAARCTRSPAGRQPAGKVGHGARSCRGSAGEVVAKNMLTLIVVPAAAVRLPRIFARYAR